MEVDDSLYQSISVKKPSKQIKKKKVKYMNITIFFLLIHCICFIIQKYREIEIEGDTESSNRKIYNYFLIGEDIFITLFIIISLCKINNNFIILFCLLYVLLAIIMIFYLIINTFNTPKIIDDTFLFVFYLINIALFLVEGILLFFCSEIMEKEKIQVKREKYGYKNKNNINQ